MVTTHTFRTPFGRALAILLTLGLAAGSLVGVAGVASADPTPLGVTIAGALDGPTGKYVPLGASLTATLTDDAPAVNYAWTVSDNGKSVVVATTATYTPIVAYKNDTIVVKVTDVSDSSNTATSPTPILITGGNLQTTQPRVTVGSSFGVTGTFFAASTNYVVTFNGDTGTSVTTDATGSFTQNIAVPANTSIGTLTISVQSAVGKITSTTIVVAASPSTPTMTVTTPRITGTVAYGQHVEVVLGAWTAGTTFTYRWQRDGTNITGATSPRYAPTSADVGHSLRVRIIGSSETVVVTAYSDSHSVARATFKSTPRITIKGTLKRGHKLKAVVTGSFSPTATKKFAWYVNGVKVAGSSSSIIVKGSWKKKRVTVRLTGSRSGYTTVTKSYTTVKKVLK